MTVLQHYRGSTSCSDLVMGIVSVLKPHLKVCKKFRTAPTKDMALVVQSSLWLKMEYLSSICSEVFADFQRQFSCSDDAHNKI